MAEIRKVKSIKRSDIAPTTNLLFNSDGTPIEGYKFADSYSSPTAASAPVATAQPPTVVVAESPQFNSKVRYVNPYGGSATDNRVADVTDITAQVMAQKPQGSLFKTAQDQGYDWNDQALKDAMFSEEEIARLKKQGVSEDTVNHWQQLGWIQKRNPAPQVTSTTNPTYEDNEDKDNDPPATSTIQIPESMYRYDTSATAQAPEMAETYNSWVGRPKSEVEGKALTGIQVAAAPLSAELVPITLRASRAIAPQLLRLPGPVTDIAPEAVRQLGRFSQYVPNFIR